MKLIGNIKEKCSRTYKRYCNFPPQGSVFVESDRTFPFFQGLGFGKKKLAQNMPLVIIKHLYKGLSFFIFNVFHKNKILFCKVS